MWKRVLERLAAVDTVFGSDVYVDYSHRYVWQANQFGHLLIGAFATLLIGWGIGRYDLGAAVVLGIYALKEGIDAAIALGLRQSDFSLDRREILADGAVDFSFVALGAAWIVAAAPGSGSGWLEGGLTLPSWALPALLVGTLLFFEFVRRPFLARKDAFDRSGLPQLVRLSTFPAGTIDDPQAIETFARRGEGSGGQWVITGAPGSGRSTLGKSMGGDATAHQRRVRYLSGSRLLEKRTVGREPVSAPTQPYQLGEADLVIIDDLPSPFLRALGSGGEQISALIDPDAGEGRSIFELSPLDEAGNPVRDPRSLPQIVWIIDDPEAAREFAEQALPARFPEGSIALIQLAGRLSDRRRSATGEKRATADGGDR